MKVKGPKYQHRAWRASRPPSPLRTPSAAESPLPWSPSSKTGAQTQWRGKGASARKARSPPHPLRLPPAAIPLTCESCHPHPPPQAGGEALEPGWAQSPPEVGTGCPRARLLLPSPQLQAPPPWTLGTSCFSSGLVAWICVPWTTRRCFPFLLRNHPPNPKFPSLRFSSVLPPSSDF